MKRLVRAGAALALAATQAAAQEPAAKNQAVGQDPPPAIEAIVPEGMGSTLEQFQYSPAVRAGDFVYLAGVVAGLEMEGGVVLDPSDENMERSYRNAFAHIERVLQAAGADLADVVEMTTYHTDLRDQGDAFMTVKRELISEPYPAWTAIDVDRLWPDGGITEIKIVAYAPRGRVER